MKKMILGVCIIAMAFCGTVLASGTAVEMPTESGKYVITSEVIAVLTTGVTVFTALSTVNQERFSEAYINNSAGAAVVFRVDGSNPTAGGIGNILSSGNGLIIKDIRAWNNFRAITQSSSGSGSSLFATIFGK
ncbi:MAG: hypothetical protein ABIE47_02365 [Pseudomonadota bacterium]